MSEAAELLLFTWAVASDDACPVSVSSVALVRTLSIFTWISVSRVAFGGEGGGGGTGGAEVVATELDQCDLATPGV